MRYAISLLCLLFLFGGCKKNDPITACINEVPVAFAGTPVTLTSCSFNATSYLWDFGDGSTSTQVSPSHTYASAGTYTVTLTATGSGGSVGATKSITVQGSNEINYNPGAYKRVYVSRIDVPSYPRTNTTGGNWDSDGLPDLFVYMLNMAQGSLFDNRNNYRPDVNYSGTAWDLSSAPYAFSFPPEETKFNILVTLLDVDGGLSETVAKTLPFNLFAPQYYGQSQITIIQGSFTLKLDLIWE